MARSVPAVSARSNAIAFGEVEMGERRRVAIRSDDGRASRVEARDERRADAAAGAADQHALAIEAEGIGGHGRLLETGVPILSATDAKHMKNLAFPA